jgi:hypothetical protein
MIAEAAWLDMTSFSLLCIATSIERLDTLLLPYYFLPNGDGEGVDETSTCHMKLRNL